MGMSGNLIVAFSLLLLSSALSAFCMFSLCVFDEKGWLYMDDGAPAQMACGDNCASLGTGYSCDIASCTCKKEDSQKYTCSYNVNTLSCGGTCPPHFACGANSNPYRNGNAKCVCNPAPCGYNSNLKTCGGTCGGFEVCATSYEKVGDSTLIKCGCEPPKSGQAQLQVEISILEKISIPLRSTSTIQATITNKGASALETLPVTITIGTTSSTKTVSIPAGGSATVSENVGCGSLAIDTPASISTPYGGKEFVIDCG